MKDKIIDPFRAILIPKFEEVKAAAINTGALGSGISGSGPSIYALSKGMKTAMEVGNAMKTQFDDIDIEYEVHVSKINEEGIKIISS
jgi:homoserine kinase